MNEEVHVENTELEQKQEEPKQEEIKQEAQKVKSSEVVRELSKTFSVNLWDENGLTMLKEKLVAKETEEETLKTKVKELTEKETLFAQKEQEYQIKLSALSLGFAPQQLDEVLALAKINTKEGETIDDGLKAVKEKYGKVFAINENFGLQFNDIPPKKPDVPRTEQEQYMARNPKVQYWENRKNKK